MLNQLQSSIERQRILELRFQEATSETSRLTAEYSATKERLDQQLAHLKNLLENTQEENFPEPPSENLLHEQDNEEDIYIDMAFSQSLAEIAFPPYSGKDSTLHRIFR